LLNAETGELVAQVDAAEWASREVVTADMAKNGYGMGRELFTTFRQNATGAEEGAVSMGLAH
jgi:phosphogluconate dehydratase